MDPKQILPIKYAVPIFTAHICLWYIFSIYYSIRFHKVRLPGGSLAVVCMYNSDN